MIIPDTSVNDIDFSKVKEYINAIQKSETDDEIEISESLLTNLNIIKDSRLSLGGLLFFAKKP